MNKRIFAMLLALIMLTGVLTSLAEDEILVLPDEEVGESIREDVIMTEESLPQYEGGPIEIDVLPVDDGTEMIHADIPDATQSGMADPVSVKLNKKKATCFVGVTLQLKATVKPADADPTVTWQSSNKKVAKVSKTGLVTPLKAGKATITVKTKNKKTYNCTITVKANRIENLSAKPTAKKVKAVKGKWTLYPKSLSYISGGKLRAELYLLNGTSKASTDIKNMTLQVKANGKVIAEHTFKKVKVKAKKNSFATFKVTFPTESLKVSPIKLKKYKASKYKFSVSRGLTMTAGKAIAYKAVNVKYFTSEKQAILEKARKEMPDDIKSVAAKYTDKKGYVKPKDVPNAIAAVADYLSTKKADGAIKDYHADEYGVMYIDAARSELWFWSPAQEGTLSGGSIQYTTLSAFNRGEVSVGIGKDIAAAVDHITSKEYALTPENLEGIGSNQVVVIRTHGGYSHLSGVKKAWNYIATGVPFTDATAKKYNVRYNADTLNAWDNNVECAHAIVPEKGDPDMIAIMPKFIRNRCKNSLKDSLIWLGACHTLQVNELADAFRSRGASAVVGFTEEVSKLYGDRILKTTMETMCRINSTTGMHYTLEDALAKAKEDHGPKDTGGKKIAEAKIIGDKKYSFYTALSGYIFRKSDGATVVPGVKVICTKTSDAHEVYEATTNSNGYYNILLSEGTYTVRLEKTGLVPVKDITLTVNGGEEAQQNWDIEVNGVLHGKVMHNDGSPVPDAKVEARLNGAVTASATTDIIGQYRLEIGSPDATVTFSKDEYRTETFSPEVSMYEEREHNQTLHSIVTKVLGKVTDAESGEPIEGVTFTVTDADTGASAVLYGKPTLTSLYTGDFAFDIGPGKYTVTAKKEGYQDASNALTVAEDEIGASLNVQMKKQAATSREYITFGHYEQDNNTANGKEPIDWIVLERDGKTAKLISKYGLDCKRYHEQWCAVTWETCTLRTWLNGDFLNDAFTAEERAQLETVTVTADANPYCSTDPGNDTQDKVFLLSYVEAERYFDSNDDRKCQPTAYVKSQGKYTYPSGNCCWWLRSPGYLPDHAASVYPDGRINSYSLHVARDVEVRPVVVLRLS